MEEQVGWFVCLSFPTEEPPGVHEKATTDAADISKPEQNPWISSAHHHGSKQMTRDLQVEWVEIRPSAAGDSKYAAGRWDGGRGGTGATSTFQPFFFFFLRRCLLKKQQS